LSNCVDVILNGLLVKKIRANYSDESLQAFTADFLNGGIVSPGNVERVREKIRIVREENYDALFLEMMHAVILITLEDALEGFKKYENCLEISDQRIELADQMVLIGNRHIALAEQQITSSEEKTKDDRRKGGKGRSIKLKRSEIETIRLYKLGTWDSIPLAATELTPIVVKFSKNGNGNLSPSTTKPLKWIRNYVYPKEK
jgi:hypothetical protein